MRLKRVGSEVVSAMTQTPASGPFGPVTTPPMSSGSRRTAAPGDWLAPGATCTAANRTAQIAAMTPELRKRVEVVVMGG